MVSSSISTLSAGRSDHWDTIPANFERSRTFPRQRSSWCKARLIVKPPVVTRLRLRCSLPTSKKHYVQQRRTKHDNPDNPGSAQTTHSEDNHASYRAPSKLCTARRAVPARALSHSQSVTPPE